MKQKLIFASLSLFCAYSASSSLPFFAREVPEPRLAFEPFVDPLPIPAHIRIDPSQPEITMHLTQLTNQLHRDFAGPATLWGYNGMSPGPVIDVEKNQAVRIHWQNDLPTKHLFPMPAGTMTTGPMDGSRVVFDGPRTPDAGTMGGMTVPGAPTLPDVRNVTHLHGAVVSESDPMNRLYNNDGWPDAWNVPGQQQIADYPNQQDARALWYHDHAFGQTGRNVAAGLAGMYVIHDDYERYLNLPSGQYEIPLIFQTFAVNGNGTVHYTDLVSNESFGNAVAVNGKILPYLNVEPRRYRFRMLDASNARMYGLHLVTADSARSPGPAFYQIGTDAGFLQKTAVLNDPNDPNAPLLFLQSGERADVIIDFSQYAGQEFILDNSNAISDPDGELPIPQLMLFRVGTSTNGKDTSSLPDDIRKIEKLKPEDVAVVRRIDMSQIDFPTGASLFQLNHRSWVYPKMNCNGNVWDYEIDTKPQIGNVEIWELVNTTTMIHPFHIHLMQFGIVDRRNFDVDQYKKTGNLVYTSDPIPADPNENGWKDIARANPKQVTRIIMRIGPYPGYYAYHCHILEHEDMDMMVPFQVVNSKQK